MLIVIVFILAHLAVLPMGYYVAGQLVGKRVPAFMQVVLAILTIASLCLITFNLKRYQHSRQRLAWPTVRGTVIEAEVVGNKRVWVSTGLTDTPINETAFTDATPPNVRGDRNLRPRITYVYTVEGEVYQKTSDLRLPGFGGTLNRLDVGIKSIAEYPPGKEVVVHYEPGSPAVSQLRPGPTWDVYMQLAFGMLIYGITLGALIRATRHNQRLKDEASA